MPASGTRAAAANTATNPTVANSDRSVPRGPPSPAPSVDPITKSGVTSPPGRPLPRHHAVAINLRANTVSRRSSPASARSDSGSDRPAYARPATRRSASMPTPPRAARTAGLGTRATWTSRIRRVSHTNAREVSPKARPATTSAPTASTDQSTSSAMRSAWSAPSARATVSPTSAATMAGARKAGRGRTRGASKANTSPAHGRPNTAPNPAASAAVMSACRDRSSRPTRRAPESAKLPDMARAVPSRPTDPPTRWVIQVPTRTTGAMSTGTPAAVGDLISVMTSRLPNAARPATRWWNRPRTPPASGSR